MANLTINTLAQTHTPASIVALLLSTTQPGLTVVPGSEIFQGNPAQIGAYAGATRTTIPPDPSPSASTPALGYGFIADTGVALATGRMYRPDTAFPNDAWLISFAPGDYFEFTDNLGIRNQPYSKPIATLVGISNNSVFDPAALSFSFIADYDQLRFSFYFSSYEYETYIGTAFTDTFVVLLDGVNIALLPGTSTYIAVNTVNYSTTPAWVVRGRGQRHSGTAIFNKIGGGGLVCDNRDDLGPVAGVDGLGNYPPIVISTPITPNVVHTLQFLIADVADGNVDSVVCFPAHSLYARPPCSGIRSGSVIGA